MPIVSKPRQIRIDLDPDRGFPVGMSIESIQSVEENDIRVADLAPHVESLAPDSPQALVVLGAVTSAATTALLFYQSEVQRLAGELSAAMARIAELESAQPSPSMPG